MSMTFHQQLLPLFVHVMQNVRGLIIDPALVTLNIIPCTISLKLQSMNISQLRIFGNYACASALCRAARKVAGGLPFKIFTNSNKYSVADRFMLHIDALNGNGLVRLKCPRA